MKTTIAILVAAATTLAVLSPASAKPRDNAKTPVCATVAVPLMLGVGY